MGCSTSAPNKQPTQASNEQDERRGRRLSVAPQIAAYAHKPNLIEEKTANLTDKQKVAKAEHPCWIASQKGYLPHNNSKVNQDRPVHKYALNEDSGVHLFGCMDGHGEFGHMVSAFVKSNLPSELEKLSIRKDPHNSILKATASVCEKLKTLVEESETFSVEFSGTTCVYAVIIDQKMYVANIGDSRAISIRQTASGDCQAVALSEDQKPDSPGERERIIEAGGRVEQLPGYAPGEESGPMRVWLKDEQIPGLAMSRSIGDSISHVAGVIDVPEIKEYDITDDDKFFIFASDGVWEFLSCEQVAELVWKDREDPEKAVTNLIARSTSEWEAEEDVIDDITAVLVQWNSL